VGIFDTEFEGAYANHLLWAKHIGVTHHTSGAHATGGGIIEVVRNGPRLDLRGLWTDFRWPLAASLRRSTARRAISRCKAHGRIRFTHRHGAGQDLPPMRTTIEGSLARDRFTFTRVDVDLYGGHAT